MLAFLQVMLTFAALLALCAAAAHKLRLPAGMAPFFVLCATILWYSAAGCLDLLGAAGAVWFAAAIASLAWLWLRRRALEWKNFATPSAVFFVLAGVAVIALLAVRQPLFMEWDEFSFWGIAPKVVKSTGRLYTFEPDGMRVTSYVPGLVMLDYAFEFLGAAFVPWKVYAAYDLLLFAAFALVLCAFERRSWALAVPMAALLCLLPYLLTVYQRDIYVNSIYMNCYADIPMGLLFGAPLAAYFVSKQKTPALLACVVMGVTVECITKDIGFALCLIAAGIAAFDLLFWERGEVRFARLRGIPARLCWCAALFGAPLAAFFGWAMHMKAVSGVDRFDIGGARNMGMAEMLFTGIAELLSPHKSEKFTAVMSAMNDAFWHSKITMFSAGGAPGRVLNGSGAMVFAVVAVLLAAAFVYAKKEMRRSIVSFGVLGALGFAAFYIFTGFTYVYVFKDVEAASLSSYNRYIYPYYLGLVLAALALLARSLNAAPPHSVGAGFLLAFTLGCGARTLSFVQPQLSVLDYPDGYFAGRRMDNGFVEQAKTALTHDDRVFLVSQGDDGKRWFMQYYEFYPEVIMDYSFGGGTLSPQYLPQKGALTGAQDMHFTPEQIDYFTSHALTPEVLCQYLEASGCTALYLDATDDGFAADYGALFTDGLTSGARLYRVEGSGSAMRFVPVPEGGAAS